MLCVWILLFYVVCTESLASNWAKAKPWGQDFQAREPYGHTAIPEISQDTEEHQRTSGGSSYWDKFRKRAAAKTADIQPNDSILVEDQTDYFGDLDIDLAYAEHAKLKYASNDFTRKTSANLRDREDVREQERSPKLPKKSQRSQRPSHSSRRGSQHEKPGYDRYSGGRATSSGRYQDNTPPHDGFGQAHIWDDIENWNNPHRGRGNGRARERFRGRGGSTRSRRELSAQDVSRDATSRRYSASSYGEPTDYTNDQHQYSSQWNEVDSYWPGCSPKHGRKEWARETASYSLPQQDNLSNPAGYFMSRNDATHRASESIAGFMHPDRARLMSPYNDAFYDIGSDKSDSRLVDVKDVAEQANKQLAPAPIPTLQQNRGPMSPRHDAGSERPAPSQNKGLSAEDGHQWVRDDRIRGGGKGRTRGRGRRRGGRNRRGGRDRGANDDRESSSRLTHRTRSPASPRRYRGGRKWVRDD